MLGKDFTFHEAMRDSPNFRYELGQNERHFDRLQKRMNEVINSVETAIDHGQQFVASLHNMTSSLHRLWLDLQIDETKNQTIVDTYKQMTDSISQICYLNKSLLEHAFPSLKAGLNSFMKRELGKLTEVKSHFDSLSGSLTEALSKKAAINKNKVQELHDAENSLTAIGTCFSHTSLDYVAQINIVHALKCPVILETLWAFVKEHANFFTRGAQFFAEQQELTIGDALATMRASYKQIERRMQDRHTFVPKEIFQYPTGIPPDPECIMEGYLFKRATNAFKTWNRRWFMIKEGKLLYSHKSTDGEPEVPTVMEEDLKLCLVRPAAATIDRACCFELVTPTKNHLLQADSESLCNAWIRALQTTIQALHENPPPRKSLLDIIDVKSQASVNSETTSTSSAFNDSETSTVTSSQWEEKEALNLALAEQQSENGKHKFLRELLAIPGNEKCADCGCADAKWTSLNLGIIICIECSGVHRSLGVHFSKVRSLTMDTLEQEHRNILLQLGNNKVNSIFLRNQSNIRECQFVSFGVDKHSDREKRENWIKDKYVGKLFARQSLPLSHSRSHSSLNAATSNGDPFTNLVKLRTIDVGNESSHCKKSLIGTDCNNRLSRNSFGSDSNMMQSARAAVACRESSASFKEHDLLVEAIREGNIEELFKWLVQRDFDLSGAIQIDGSHFTTPLHLAAENNQTTMVEFILLNGAKINGIDENKNTALHAASERGHTIVVYQLLKRNAEKGLRNEDDKTALELAVEKCHAECVTLLRLHDMKEEFNDDQNSTMDETVENFIGDLAAKQGQMHKSSSKSIRDG